MSQLTLSTQPSNLSPLSLNLQQQNVNEIKSVAEPAKHIEKFDLNLVVKLISSMGKLPWSILLKVIEYSWEGLNTLGKKVKNSTFIIWIIDVLKQLQDHSMERIDSVFALLRQKDYKPMMVYQQPQFDDQQLKKMFQKPSDFLLDSSNQVLFNLKQENNKRTITYYVPTYLRVLLKNFTAIDLQKLQAEVNVDIIITFVYGNKGMLKLPKEVANRLNKEVVLNFERDEPLRLTAMDSDHVSVKEDEEKSYITFTVRKKFHMKIESDVYYTPFERLDLLFPVTIQQMTVSTINANSLSHEFESPRKENAAEKVYEAGIKFNYMDNKTPFVRLDFKDGTDFGNYSIIESGLETRYSNKRIQSRKERVKKDEEKKSEEERHAKMRVKVQRKRKLMLKSNCTVERRLKLQKEIDQLQVKQLRRSKFETEKSAQLNKTKPEPDHFQYSLFKIPIYKHPFASLVMIFLPLWSLSIIKLGIFFQGEALSDRISSIAGVMIAFIALIPLIRSQIPPNPTVLFIEYLVYAEIFASFLCLMDSLQVRAIENYQMEWTQNPFYIMALMILLIQVVVIILMAIYHFTVSLHNYRLDDDGMGWKKDKNKSKFNHFNWGNEYCDKQFIDVIKNTKLEIQHKNGKEQWEAQKLADVNLELQSKNGNFSSSQQSKRNSQYVPHADSFIVRTGLSESKKSHTEQ